MQFFVLSVCQHLYMVTCLKSVLAIFCRYWVAECAGNYVLCQSGSSANG